MSSYPKPLSSPPLPSLLDSPSSLHRNASWLFKVRNNLILLAHTLRIDRKELDLVSVFVNADYPQSSLHRPSFPPFANPSELSKSLANPFDALLHVCTSIRLGARDLGHQIKASAAVDIAFTINPLWTNATFEETICRLISEATSSISSITITNQYPQTGVFGLPLFMPDCFFSLNSLNYLRLEGIALTGSSSTGGEQDPLLRLPKFLYSIDLNNCLLLKTGQTTSDSYAIDWPSFFNISGFDTLKLQKTNIEGELPKALPSRFRNFYIRDNPLVSGPLPIGFFSLLVPNALDIRITGTSISGPIPSDLFASINFMTAPHIFDFGNNKLSGTIPEDLFSNASLTGIVFLTVSFGGNELEGTLPTSLFAPLSNISTGFELRLNDNNLSGAIPDTLLVDMRIPGGWGSLFLDLSGNAFTGTIPNILTNLNADVNLPTFRMSLANNKLEGTVPTGIWPPTRTRISTVELDFSSNSILGGFPVGVFRNIPSTVQNIGLWLAGNSLSGPIPPNLFEDQMVLSLTKLNFSLARNKLTGAVSTAVLAQAAPRIQEVIFDISSNDFGGSIPSTYFTNLYSAPGVMKRLSVSLANCKLTGNLPLLKTRLTSLAVNLDDNQLTIPDTRAYFTNSASETETISLSAARNALYGLLYLGTDTLTSTRYELNFYGNDFSTLDYGYKGYFSSLNVGMNVGLYGNLKLGSHWDFTTFIANGTKLDGKAPSSNIGWTIRVRVLDVSNTGITFCGIDSQWVNNLQYCRLANTDYRFCPEKMPPICQQAVYELPAPPAAPPAAPGAPRAGAPDEHPNSASSVALGAVVMIATSLLLLLSQ